MTDQLLFKNCREKKLAASLASKPQLPLNFYKLFLYFHASKAFCYRKTQQTCQEQAIKRKGECLKKHHTLCEKSPGFCIFMLYTMRLHVPKRFWRLPHPKLWSISISLPPDNSFTGPVFSTSAIFLFIPLVCRHFKGATTDVDKRHGDPE